MFVSFLSILFEQQLVLSLWPDFVLNIQTNYLTDMTGVSANGGQQKFQIALGRNIFQTHNSQLGARLC